MAGGELWGVWAQTMTNDTGAANVEKYGEVEDMAEAYRDGFAKDFCDGQTSPTPPRWPDDGMQLLYFYDRESAELVSQFLREDISDRIETGALRPAVFPSWSDISGAPLASLLSDIQSSSHSMQDVIEGRVAVGLESGEFDAVVARESGLYTERIRGILVYSRDPEDMSLIREYFETGGRYGTPTMSRLLGYKESEIAQYSAFLRSVGGVRAELLTPNAAESAFLRTHQI